MDSVSSERVLSVSFHPSLPLVALGCETSRIKVYNLKARVYVALVPHIGRVRAVEWSPCGSFLASAASAPPSASSTESYTINIWVRAFAFASLRAWTRVCTYERMYVLDGWMYVRMNGWMDDEWMDG